MNVKTSKVYIQHLDKMEPKAFIEFCSKLDGILKKSEISITEKIDGSALRIGLDSENKLFIESATSTSMFNVGDFEARDKSKGYSGKIGRGFDEILAKMKTDIELVAVLKKHNTNGIKVVGEILYMPFGIEDFDAIKFIRISYDKSSLGSEWTFVPFKVIDGFGNKHPCENAVIIDILKISTSTRKYVLPQLSLTSDIDISLELSDLKQTISKYNDLDILLKSRKKIDQELKKHIKDKISEHQKAISNKILTYIEKGSFGNDYEGVVIEFKDGTIVKVVSDSFKNRKVDIKECGHAVKGVVRITHENTKSTCQNIEKFLESSFGINSKDYTTLGSVGKKIPGESSGDIDYAISVNALAVDEANTYDEIIEKIENAAKRGNFQYRVMRPLGIVSLAFPIENTDGNQPDSYVQVDFMLVDSVNYAKWSYFSPHHLESAYKGLYRNEINFMVGRYAGYKVTNIDHKTNTPISWERSWIDLNKGLLKGIQFVTKTKRNTDKINTEGKYLYTNDPDKLVKILYGSKYEAKDILTFEQALDAVLSPDFPHKKYRKEILRDSAKGINKKGYPIPDILEKHL